MFHYIKNLKEKRLTTQQKTNMKRSFAEIYKIAHKLTHNEKMQIKEH